MKIRLAAIELEDMDFFREMYNDPELSMRIVSWQQVPVSRYTQQKWYEDMISDKNNIRFSIKDQSDTPLGGVYINQINWHNRSGDLGIKVAKRYQHKGVATEAVKKCIEFAFINVGLHRLEYSCLSSNVASKRVCENCGFVFEGIKRQAIFRNGRYEDLCMYSIIDDEWH